MLKCAMPAIGSLLFMLLLFFVYNSKPRYASIENKIFRSMVNILIVAIILEIISYITMFNRHSIPIINEIFCRGTWLLNIAWVTYLSIYIFCLGWNYKANNIFELIKIERKFKIIITFSIITMIIFCIFPFDYYVLRENAYLNGFPCFFAYFVGSVLISYITIYTIKNKANLSKEKLFQLYFVIVITIIMLPVQIIFPHLSIRTTCFALEMYIIYFSLENPDLFMISELEEAKKQADMSSSAKTDFLSNMSHEIRSPINAIIGFSESILNESTFDKEKTRNDINNIKAAGSGLIDIINNILDISKIENETESLNNVEYSLEEIVNEISSIVVTRIGDKKITFITDIDKNLPSKLLGDKTKIYQVLMNLLTNAVKYSEVGKIFLKINGRVINNKVNLHFEVTDTGYGIKKEDFDKLFNKFVRLDTALNNDIEGTGLGLVITKKLVTLMGGNITFESEYEVGTSFYVDLTQDIVDFTPIGKANLTENSTSEINYLDCSNYSVLIVDDNKLNIKVAERLIEKYKFKITSVCSGNDCIYKIKEGNKYDIIFMDHMMPEMDGIECLHIIKALDGYDIPPVVALTANAITGMKDMYLKEGFDDYLSKPLTINELNRVVMKYFDRR